jgi:two-component system, chemotaxis family, sensor kinase CheA
VSDISGRGVGMDIVKSSLEKIGGKVFIESKIGVGSKFSIHLPLTLAILRALLVIAHDQPYVIPLSSVVEMLRLGGNQGGFTRATVGGQAAIIVREQTIPLIDLDKMLQANPGACSPENIRSDALVVVVSHNDRIVGVCVDSVGGEQEVVLKTLGTLLGEIPGISGASILGDGKVALIVDVGSAIDEIIKIRKVSEKNELLEEIGMVAA